MLSMTGFGSASRTRGGVAVTVEARSVNNRYLKLTVRTPSSLSAREHELETLVREQVERGSVSLGIRIARNARPVRVQLNPDAVEGYTKQFRRLKKESGVTGEPTLELLAGLPGVFSLEEVEDSVGEEEWQFVREVAGQAVTRMVRMRAREGTALKRDLAGRLKTAAGLVKAIAARAPAVAREWLGRLHERVERLVRDRGMEISDRDLTRELAVFTERSDISEELTRLLSHIEQARAALVAEGPVGRRLDFLVQEMGREANTASAKAADTELAKHCVDLKVELDRMREQVQNVE